MVLLFRSAFIATPSGWPQTHGFGCDQAMWRFVAPHFQDAFKVITMDHVGAGNSDLAAYDSEKYATLNGYASDIVEIGHELGIRNGIFAGHSVSAMIGVLASLKAPDIFDTLILVGPFTRYIDDGDYHGGFSASDIEELLACFADNPLAWSAAMGPAIMGNSDRPALGDELTKLLQKRSGDRAPVRAGNLHVRQPRRPSEGHGANAHSAVPG